MAAREEGKYLYGIIEARGGLNLGPVGLGGQEVAVIAYRDLGAVISNAPPGTCAIAKENLLAHERVLERVMEEHAVLPVRFGTVAANAEEIRWILERGYRELKHLLRDMDGKVELGVKALWRDMDHIFREVAEENEEIRRLRAGIAGRPSRLTHVQRIAIGQMVQAALEAKKEREGEELLRDLRRLAVDHRVHRTIGDRMLLNAVFLVDRDREGEFDDLMERLEHRHRERLKFVYVGPAPPYNFVDLALSPRERAR
ncbi:MAG: GvpL/GvpF family gas vesicle protein [Candidatus Rokubacteria bacterium]|nr:GvpL/GvpF family gas vesicle protein [Candidatus Rokubacteria bacterium]